MSEHHVQPFKTYKGNVYKTGTLYEQDAFTQHARTHASGRSSIMPDLQVMLNAAATINNIPLKQIESEVMLDLFETARKAKTGNFRRDYKKICGRRNRARDIKKQSMDVKEVTFKNTFFSSF